MMRRLAGGFGSALVLLLGAAAAGAGDSPEVVQQKQQYMRAYNAAFASGLCDMYRKLKAWQPTGWPDGQEFPELLLRGLILPQYANDANALAGRSTADLEREYAKFCEATAGDYNQALSALKPVAEKSTADKIDNTEKERFTARLQATYFLGQCNSAFQAWGSTTPFKETAKAKQVQAFVIEMLHKDDPMTKIPEFKRADAATGGQAAVDKLVADAESWHAQYWKDCDTAKEKYQEVAKQLTVVP